MFRIRRMVPADIDNVAAAQARAFFGDPLQVWALPDDSTRLEFLTEMFAVLTAAYSLPFGESYTDPTGAVAALWTPPGRFGEPPSAAAIAELDRIDARIGTEAGARYSTANTAMRAVHPGDPHWYLQGLGTDPPRQNQGLGSAAMTPVLARADADDIPAYLESTKEGNLSFYERHGFVVTGTIEIPDGGPTLWTMRREPRQ